MCGLTFQKCNNPQEADDTNSKDINYSLTSLAEINKNSFSSVCVCGFVFCVFFGYCGVIQSRTLSTVIVTTKTGLGP